jgi:hypothetical protein
MSENDQKVSITVESDAEASREQILDMTQACFRLYANLKGEARDWLEMVILRFYKREEINRVKFMMVVNLPGLPNFRVEATFRRTFDRLWVVGHCDYGSLPLDGPCSPQNVADALQEVLRVRVQLRRQDVEDEATERLGALNETFSAMETGLIGGGPALEPSDLIADRLVG